MVSPQHVLAFDPGGTTGVAQYNLESKRVKGFHLEGEAHHLDLWNLLKKRKPVMVVYERFDYRPMVRGSDGKQQMSVDLRAREYIGILRLWCQLNQVPYKPQSPMKGEHGLWQDRHLKQVGILKTPKSTWPHANDAIRHLMYFITTTKRPEFMTHRGYWLNKRNT